MNFKLKCVGFDTANLEFPVSFCYSNLAETSVIGVNLRSNNASIIGLGFPESGDLIVTADFFDGLHIALAGLLLDISRPRVDILLMESGSDFSKYTEEIKSLLHTGMVMSIGIKNPKTIKELESVKGTISCIALDLCPYNFDPKIIEWAEKNDKKIIGYNPFGGRLNAQIVIETFTVPFLLGFAARYCDIVMLSDDFRDDATYLKDLIGQEASDIYDLNKSVSKLIKAPKQLISTALKIDSELTIPYNYPRAIFNPTELEISLQSIQDPQQIDTGDSLVQDKVVGLGIELITTLKQPEDGDNLDFISILIPKIEEILRIEYPKSSLVVSSVGSDIFVFNLTRTESSGFLKKKKTSTETNYLLYVPKDISKSIFRKLELADNEE